MSTIKNNRTSTLALLRGLAPDPQHGQAVSFQTALRIAERQAEEFLRLSGLTDSLQPVPGSIVTSLPRVRVVHDRMPNLPDEHHTSGLSQYGGGQWLIVINSADHRLRQRFTLMHEFKHVLDHRVADLLYTGRPWLDGAARTEDAARQRERAADHFAGCVLMPKSRMLRLWANDVRTAENFARHFDVSTAAAAVRMEQLGLTRPRWMCTRGLAKVTTAPVHAFDPRSESLIQKMRALGLRPQTLTSRRTAYHPHPATQGGVR